MTAGVKIYCHIEKSLNLSKKCFGFLLKSLLILPLFRYFLLQKPLIFYKKTIFFRTKTIFFYFFSKKMLVFKKIIFYTEKVERGKSFGRTLFIGTKSIVVRTQQKIWFNLSGKGKTA
ncbi:MAG: hypothetical protein IKJ28_06065 [Alphaproteobacteria bacterium]|nr:hypothetical protein [Alphaproteobacteria bacterium]